jgi:hypothetical protein
VIIPFDPQTLQIIKFFAGFEVLTAVVMKSCAFWDITMCKKSKVVLVLN